MSKTLKDARDIYPDLDIDLEGLDLVEQYEKLVKEGYIGVGRLARRAEANGTDIVTEVLAERKALAEQKRIIDIRDFTGEF